jgi:signal transduction histidine kinase
MLHSQGPLLRLIVGALVVLTLALGIFYLLMQPSLRELGLMALFLAITSALTVSLGYAAYRLGWIRQSPRLRWALLGTYALSSLLTFLNVWITARLMFASRHDLILATILLIFAGGIAMALGTLYSAALTERISRLGDASRALRAGRLNVRAPVEGRDELAELAQAFNEMAARLQDAAERQQKLEGMRRDLIAWASHDLQTPLASVRAIVEAVADGVVEDPQTVRRYLKTAQSQIRSLSVLIDDLFQMAQLDAGGLELELSQNSLTDLVSDTIESMKELAHQRGVTLQGHVEEGVDPALFDVQRVSRVIINLIGNALRHTPQGGKVEIRARRSSGQVHVEVSDTGEGIRPEDLPHVFDRFYRSEKSRSRSTGGAGLGLAIAKGLVEAHGGCIEANSEPVEGTCFRFTLPDTPPESA